jgi:hypothetical protein
VALGVREAVGVRVTRTVRVGVTVRVEVTVRVGVVVRVGACVAVRYGVGDAPGMVACGVLSVVRGTVGGAASPVWRVGSPGKDKNRTWINPTCPLAVMICAQSPCTS